MVRHSVTFSHFAIGFPAGSSAATANTVILPGAKLTHFLFENRKVNLLDDFKNSLGFEWRAVQSLLNVRYNLASRVFDSSRRSCCRFGLLTPINTPPHHSNGSLNPVCHMAR